MKNRNEKGIFIKTLKEKKCPQCEKIFMPHSSFQKNCSLDCYNESKKGKSHAWGYKIGNALRGKKRSKEAIEITRVALRKRNYRFCKVCNKRFYPHTDTSKYCSKECWNVRSSVKPFIKCKRCGTEFKRKQYYYTRYCSSECYSKDQSEKRMGKNNPAYRNGYSIRSKRGLYTGMHLRACSKYRKNFMETHDFIFCELCKANENQAMKLEVHHIYWASLYPRHPELHNPKNLILICIRDHNDFHSGKLKNEFRRLEKERGLKKLFKK
jgi:uncharacterized C2H2 Zn-finger protein